MPVGNARCSGCHSGWYTGAVFGSTLMVLSCNRSAK
jgi:hypothetical protein